MIRDKIKRRMDMSSYINYDWAQRKTDGYETIHDLLWTRVPQCGEVPDAKGSNKKLERFRMANKLIYDLFNNGLCNRRSHFMSFFRAHLSKIGSIPKYHDSPSEIEWDRLEHNLGIVYQDILLDALKEQYPELYYSSFDSKLISKKCNAILSRGQHKVPDVPEDELVMSEQ